MIDWKTVARKEYLNGCMKKAYLEMNGLNSSRRCEWWEFTMAAQSAHIRL